jgi:hypothetical protein
VENGSILECNESILVLFARAGSTLYIFFFIINRVLRVNSIYNTRFKNSYDNIL